MRNNRTAHGGAQKIIDACLALTAGQELVVVFDETTAEVAEMLLKVAQELQVQPTGLYLPTALQRRMAQSEELPLALTAALRGAAGILTCVTDEHACLPFRTQVFDVGAGANAKIGHMPGVTLDVLSMAAVDYGQIRENCDLLATALLKGEKLEIVSRDANGRDNHLRMDVGGWARPPSISNGLLKRGGWANIPAGESYIAPMEGTAEGTLIVDGSLPGYVLAPGSELRMEFSAGRLVDWHSSDARSRQIVDELRDFALARGDADWCNLAEVGLGVNPAVELTGIELLDEKKYGTAHIALGGNDWFGGAVSSAIHSDLILAQPTVRVDGKPVVNGGQIVVSPADWLEDHRQLAINPLWRDGISAVSRSGVRAVPRRGLLRREWITGRGEPDSILVGIADSARKATALYAHIPAFKGGISIEALVAQCQGWDELEVLQLLLVLDHNELLALAR
ncbi:MAG TPA: hypothetical protein VLC52_14870 [Anaerolineae bacterium]|nr:hypothetical protein [Anaerolineae bacterium]